MKCFRRLTGNHPESARIPHGDHQESTRKLSRVFVEYSYLKEMNSFFKKLVKPFTKLLQFTAVQDELLHKLNAWERIIL